MNELALFSGIGGGIYGSLLNGIRTVCAVEIDEWCRSVLLARQNDGTFPPFPVWDNVETFDGRPWRGVIDLVSGGFPCQDISVAGKRKGIDGERSGLWREMARIISEVRPRYVFVENSPNLVRHGLARILGDLAAMGFDAEWCRLSAEECGAPHERDRLWIVAKSAMADTQRVGMRAGRGKRPEEGAASHSEAAALPSETLPDADSGRELQPQRSVEEIRRWIGDATWWNSEPDVERVVYGVPFGRERTRGLGQAQVPIVAAVAQRLLMKI